MLSGLLVLLEFDDTGAVTRIKKIEAGGSAIGVDVAHGTWHTAVALQDNTVFLEAKPGPYLPLSTDEKAPWAPAENTPGAAGYLIGLRSLFAR